jgi:hypothetical protein
MRANNPSFAQCDGMDNVNKAFLFLYFLVSLIAVNSRS